MADVKISQLPVATTPLDGTEVLPIVQSATTKQVSIANVTAGRAVSALSLSLTNALPVTSGGTGIATAAQGALLSATGADTFSATRTPTLGLAGTAAGTLGLSGSTSGVVTLATQNAAGTWTLKLPTTAGTNNYLLKTDGSGNTDWVNPTALGIDLDVGTTAITAGTTGRVLYDNAGVLGEYSSVPVSFGGTGLTSLTAGYIPFGGSTTYGSDSNLFWDNTNKRLGVGTSSPAFSFQTYNASSSQFVSIVSGTASTSGLLLGDTDSAAIGRIEYVNASDLMQFYTNGSPQLYLSSAGNLGLGVTPSAWSGPALQMSNFAYSNYGFVSNCYYNGSNWIYSNTSGPARYTLSNNQHIWYQAASGSAGSTISFTQAMTLDASGNLGIGTSSPGAKLHVYGATILGSPSTFYVGDDGSSGGAFLNQTAAQPLRFLTSGTESARIDSSGNLLVGTTTAGTLLTVNGVATLCSGTATPANGSTSARLLFGTTAGFGIYYGSGAPTVSAAQGSIYLRSDGSSTSTRLYVNTNGSTTWTNVTTAA